MGATVADGVPGSSADSDDSDSVISVSRSGASDKVSHDAMGANFAFDGMSKVDAGNSSIEELDISESCLSSEMKWWQQKYLISNIFTNVCLISRFCT